MKGGFIVGCRKIQGKLKDKIKAEYMTGGTSYKKLAEKYGVSENELEKIASPKRENWRELKRKTEGKMAERLTSEIAGIKSESVTRYIRSNEKLLTMIDEALADGTISREIAELVNITAEALKKCKKNCDIKLQGEAEEHIARIEKIRAETALAKAKANTDERESGGIQLIINR